MSFGTKLREIRKQNNLLQKDMCEKLNMEQSTYSRYETDERLPTVDIINRVADTFNVSLDWLMQSEAKTVIFENGSANHGVVQTENYYAVPKDVIEALLEQQKNTTTLLNSMTLVLQQIFDKK
ncbi:helix-turn-helix domain-containing protein [Ferruginibacter sp.]|nr:helix-turn-helix transcriptional regulator [Ferruginibacter sp.]